MTCLFMHPWPHITSKRNFLLIARDGRTRSDSEKEQPNYPQMLFSLMRIEEADLHLLSRLMAQTSVYTMSERASGN